MRTYVAKSKDHICIVNYTKMNYTCIMKIGAQSIENLS
jgi:hypothetical protein